MTPEEYWAKIGLAEQDRWISFASDIIRKGYLGQGAQPDPIPIAIQMAARDYMKKLKERQDGRNAAAGTQEQSNSPAGG